MHDYNANMPPAAIENAAQQPAPTSGIRIAVIAWGSLIYDPRNLKLRTQWFPTGPSLPVEFCRVTTTRDRNPVRLTLALLPGAELVRTYWAELDYPDIDTARRALAEAEGTTGQQRLQKIGLWSKDGRLEGRLDFVNQHIAKWAASEDLVGVVWTDLPPNLPKSGGGTYEEFEDSLLDEAIAHFRRYENDRTIDPSWFAAARDYVETAPTQTATRCRAALELAFNWQRRSEI